MFKTRQKYTSSKNIERCHALNSNWERKKIKHTARIFLIRLFIWHKNFLFSVFWGCQSLGGFESLGISVRCLVWVYIRKLGWIVDGGPKLGRPTSERGSLWERLVLGCLFWSPRMFRERFQIVPRLKDSVEVRLTGKERTESDFRSCWTLGTVSLSPCPL